MTILRDPKNLYGARLAGVSLYLSVLPYISFFLP
jgi:hypothetical protein